MNVVAAIGQTKGKVFIEELRSSADGTQWGVTGIPNQERIKKINRLRLMRMSSSISYENILNDDTQLNVF